MEQRPRPSRQRSAFRIPGVRAEYLECLAVELEFLLASACAASKRSLEHLLRYGIRPPSDLVAPGFPPTFSPRREADPGDRSSPHAVARGRGGAGALGGAKP